MTILRNLSAYTTPGGSYPPFISINETTGGVSFTVRQNSPAPGVAGKDAGVVVERSVAIGLLEEALAKLKGE